MSPIQLRGPSATNTTAWYSPGEGITPDEHGQTSFPTSMWVFAVSAAALAIYNALELVVMVFLTFRRYRGLYFYSLLVSGLAIVPYTLGFLLDLLSVTTGRARWLAVTLITLGWWPMVTGQAVVLWSRLHLIVFGGTGERVIRWTRWMIVINAIILHLPTTVFTFGSNGSIDTQAFAIGYNIMEKIQMAGFFCQEVIMSSIYIVETSKIFRTSLQADTRTTMRQLAVVNGVIILMDLALLGMEAGSLYILETMLKGFVYSIKLKLELAVLGKLVKLVGGSRSESEQSSCPAHRTPFGFVRPSNPSRGRKNKRASAEDTDESLSDMTDISEFVDLTRLNHDVTYASEAIMESSSPSRAMLEGRHRTEAEAEQYKFARFEHVEDVKTLQECSV